MTIQELLIGICFTQALFFSVVAGKQSGAIGILIGVIVGLALGFAGLLGVRATFNRVNRHSQLGKRKPQFLWMIFSWFLFLVLLVSIVGLGILGKFVTRLVIRYVAA
jgi:uncharacterized BrkB/YihY/UPF0761 family membrane protein